MVTRLNKMNKEAIAKQMLAHGFKAKVASVVLRSVVDRKALLPVIPIERLNNLLGLPVKAEDVE